MKIYLLLFIIAFANGLRASSAVKEGYSFEACQKFDEKKTSGEECEIQGASRAVASLEKGMSPVTFKVTEDYFLFKLKEYLSNKIQTNIEHYKKIQKCFSTQTRDKFCQSNVEAIRKITRTGLPVLRKSMALMNQSAPVALEDVSTFNAQDLVKKEIRHPFRNMKVEPLTAQEESQFRLEIEQKYQKYLSEYSYPARFQHCFQKLGNEVRIKTTLDCEGVNLQPKMHVAQRFRQDRENQKQKEIYNNLLKQAPYLGLFSKSSLPASDRNLDVSLGNAFKILADETAKAKTEFDKKPASDMTEMFRYPELIKAFLEDMKPLTINHCDVAEEFHKQYKPGGRQDWIETAGIIGFSALGAIGCAFTAGAVCAVSVIAATESYSVGTAQRDLNLALNLYNSGLADTNAALDARSSRNVAAVLAPTSFAGVSKVARTVKGSKTAVQAEKKVVEETAEQATKIEVKVTTGASLRNVTSKEELLERFVKYNPTTVLQNVKWITLAKLKTADWYLDVENGALKGLNDSLKDKNLVTALTNLHKDFVFEKVEALKQKFPGLEISEYSDFKSSRFAFKFKDGVKPEGFDEALAQLFKEANNEFEITISKIPGLDLPANRKPAAWFSGGFGRTADEASLASRSSRSVSRPAVARSFDEVTETLQKARVGLEEARAGLEASFKADGRLDTLMVKSSSGKMIPNVKVFEILRKIKDEDTSADIAAVLSRNFGVKVTDDEAARLYAYYKNLDRFAPALWVPERIVANLDDAEFGGIGIDFKGMGAKNVFQVADDIASTTDQPISAVVDRLRLGEEIVTKEFDVAKSKYQEIMARTFHQLGIPVANKCSGDDCVSLPARALTMEEQLQVVKALGSSTSEPSKYRMTLIPPGVAKEARTQLAVHGESIEKMFRGTLTGYGEGLISPKIMDRVLFAVEMPKDLVTGDAKLIMHIDPSVTLTAEQKKMIEETFQKSMQKEREEIIRKAKEAAEKKVSKNKMSFPHQLLSQTRSLLHELSQSPYRLKVQAQFQIL